MPYIQDMIADYIRDTREAHLETRDGVRGVVFHEDGEFIPLRDLGYNKVYGFFRLSHLPNVENEAPYATWTIHPVQERHPDPDNPWQPYALLDSDGFGFLLGERWQVDELLPVLVAFLEHGEMDEPIDDDDEALGTRWLTISEAVQEANAFDAEKYPLDSSTDYRIRQVARRGNWLEIGRAKQDNGGRWKFHARRFRGWLVANRGRVYDKADGFTPDEIGEMIAERDEMILAAAEDEGNMLTVKRNGSWQIYWGTSPLPKGAEAIGTVSRKSGTGALIKLESGTFVQGNAGAIRNLPQQKVKQALGD